MRALRGFESLPLRQKLLVTFTIDMNAITTQILGHIAGGVCLLHQLSEIWRIPGDSDQTDAHSHLEDLFFPGELKVLNSFLQRIRNSTGLLQCTDDPSRHQTHRPQDELKYRACVHLVATAFEKKYTKPVRNIVMKVIKKKCMND